MPEKIPFLEYRGEIFFGEDLVWVRIARKYKMVHINKAIYIGNYMEVRLTNSCRRYNIASPIGCMHRAEEFIEPDIKFRYRVKERLQYIIYGKFSGMRIRDLIHQSRHKVLVAACIPLVLALYRIGEEA